MKQAAWPVAESEHWFQVPHFSKWSTESGNCNVGKQEEKPATDPMPNVSIVSCCIKWIWWTSLSRTFPHWRTRDWRQSVKSTNALARMHSTIAKLLFRLSLHCWIIHLLLKSVNKSVFTSHNLADACDKCPLQHFTMRWSLKYSSGEILLGPRPTSFHWRECWSGSGRYERWNWSIRLLLDICLDVCFHTAPQSRFRGQLNAIHWGIG